MAKRSLDEDVLTIVAALQWAPGDKREAAIDALAKIIARAKARETPVRYSSKAGSVPEYFAAYYYGFNATGCPEVDEILKAVASAGKRYHHTEDWWEGDEDNPSACKVIQEAANAAARKLKGGAE